MGSGPRCAWGTSTRTTGGLFYTAYALFVRWDFMRKFNMEEDIVINFMSQIEAGYHPNPYHNSMHGGDVMHIVHYILHQGGLKEKVQLSEEDTLAAIIAGMIHDYDHPGPPASPHNGGTRRPPSSRPPGVPHFGDGVGGGGRGRQARRGGGGVRGGYEWWNGGGGGMAPRDTY